MPSIEIVNLARRINDAHNAIENFESNQRSLRFSIEIANVNENRETSMENRQGIIAAFGRIIQHYQNQFNSYGMDDFSRIKEIYKPIKSMILDELEENLELLLATRAVPSIKVRPNPRRREPGQPTEFRINIPAIPRNMLTVKDVDESTYIWMRDFAVSTFSPEERENLMGVKVVDILNFVRDNKNILANEDDPNYLNILNESRKYLKYRCCSAMVAWRIFDPGQYLLSSSFENVFLPNSTTTAEVVLFGNTIEERYSKILAYYYLVMTDEDRLQIDIIQARNNFISTLSEIRRAHNEYEDGKQGAYAPKNAFQDFFSCAAGVRGRLGQLGDNNTIAKVNKSIEEILPNYIKQVANERLRARFCAEGNRLSPEDAKSYLDCINIMSKLNLEQIISENDDNISEMFCDDLYIKRSEILRILGIDIYTGDFIVPRSTYNWLTGTNRPEIIQEIINKFQPEDGVDLTNQDNLLYIEYKAKSLLLDPLLCQDTAMCNLQDIFPQPATVEDLESTNNNAAEQELTYAEALLKYPDGTPDKERRAREDVAKNAIKRSLIDNNFTYKYNSDAAADAPPINQDTCISIIEYIATELVTEYRTIDSATFDIANYCVQALNFDDMYEIGNEVRAIIDFEDVKRQIIGSQDNIMRALQNQPVVLRNSAVAVPQQEDPAPDNELIIGYIPANENNLGNNLLEESLDLEGLLLPHGRSIYRAIRDTVARRDGPYSIPLAGGLYLPTMPVIHPYDPQGNQALYDLLRGGMPDFPVTARLPVGTINNLPRSLVRLLNRNFININNLEVFFCVQNAPWNQQHTAAGQIQENQQLLLRPHPWIHNDAPCSQADYNRRDHVMAGVFDVNGSIEPEQLRNIIVHTHQEGNHVRYSPDNMRIPGINNLNISQGFYSICINATTRLAALTLHWLLNQEDYLSIKDMINGNLDMGIPNTFTGIRDWALTRDQVGGINNCQPANRITPVNALYALCTRNNQLAPFPGANRYRLQEQIAATNVGSTLVAGDTTAAESQRLLDQQRQQQAAQQQRQQQQENARIEAARRDAEQQRLLDQQRQQQIAQQAYELRQQEENARIEGARRDAEGARAAEATATRARQEQEARVTLTASTSSAAATANIPAAPPPVVDNNEESRRDWADYDERLHRYNNLIPLLRNRTAPPSQPRGARPY